nr:hypothetical protein [uncultured Allomuricauda sp.]
MYVLDTEKSCSRLNFAHTTSHIIIVFNSYFTILEPNDISNWLMKYNRKQKVIRRMLEEGYEYFKVGMNARK